MAGCAGTNKRLGARPRRLLSAPAARRLVLNAASQPFGARRREQRFPYPEGFLMGGVLAAGGRAWRPRPLRGWRPEGRSRQNQPWSRGGPAARFGFRLAEGSVRSRRLRRLMITLATTRPK